MMSSPLPYAPVSTPTKSKTGRIWAVIVVLVLLVGGAVAFGLAKGDDDSAVPRFTEVRPAAGTIRVRTDVDETLAGNTSYVIESDLQGTVLHVVGSTSGNPLDTDTSDAGTFELIVSSTELWSYDPTSSVWIRAATPDAGLHTDASVAVRTLMFSEYVPDSLRKFVTVVKVSEDVVSGKSVKVYDMRVDAPGYQRSNAADYADWAARLGIEEAEENTTLELSVDENGVVWRMSSYDTLGTTGSKLDSYTQVVEEISTSTYQPPFPTTYFDEATGQMVG